MLIGLSILLEAACAGNIRVPVEAHLRTRIMDLYTAMGTNDIETIYEITSPLVTEHLTMEGFRQQQDGAYEDFEVTGGALHEI